MHAGKYHCPVTYKVFNENTHIVAVRTTGNVYSMEVGREWLADLTPLLPHSHPSGQAVERLNLKPSNMRDLITDEPFTRADLVTLQDPTDLDKFNMSTFHHIKHSLSAEEAEGQEGVDGENIERCCSCLMLSVSYVVRGGACKAGPLLLPEDAESRDPCNTRAAVPAEPPASELPLVCAELQVE